MNPILSIVIPTKNRYEYLLLLLEYLLKSTSSEFEVVIQDNTNQNNDFLKQNEKLLNDTRVKYNHIHNSISVSENFNIAIQLAKGEYVCMLGDDDFLLLDECIELCNWMKNNSIDSMTFDKAYYKWADSVSPENSELGHMSYSTTFNLPQKRDITKSLVKQLRYRAEGLILPRLYHGIIRNNCVKKLLSEVQSVFPGPSPDMANAVAISFYINSYLHCSIPYIISGHSYKSAGGMGLRKNHLAELKDVNWLSKNDINNWSNKLPYYWSAETVIVDSIIKALEASKNNNYQECINYNAIYARSLIYDRPFLSRIVTKINQLKNDKSINISWIKIIYEIVYHIIGRGTKWISRSVNQSASSKIMYKSNSINSLVNKLSEDINKIHIDLINSSKSNTYQL